MNQGTVAIFPCDHYVSDDERFMAFVESAFEMVEACSKVIVLLGVKAEGPKVEYGWIEPGALIAGGWSNFRRLRRIQRFWEKPSQSVARELFARRCLWNSFVMIASVKALMNLFMRELPQLYIRFIGIKPVFGTTFERKAVEVLYSDLPETNFSNTILTNVADEFGVLSVTGLKWTDLGSTDRLLGTLQQIGKPITFSPDHCRDQPA